MIPLNTFTVFQARSGPLSFAAELRTKVTLVKSGIGDFVRTDQKSRTMTPVSPPLSLPKQPGPKTNLEVF